MLKLIKKTTSHLISLYSWPTNLYSRAMKVKSTLSKWIEKKKLDMLHSLLKREWEKDKTQWGDSVW